LVLSKLFQTIWNKEKDIFLMNNFLFIISNISPYFDNLNITASQSLLNLFSSLIKISKKLKNSNKEYQIFLKFIQILLEIFNFFIFFNLKKNVFLLYEILRCNESNYFLKDLDDFNYFDKKLINNMSIIINYFYSKIHLENYSSIDLIYKNLIKIFDDFNIGNIEELIVI
jgi:hypothetical protein